MGERNDGGPAFPHFIPDGHYNGSVHYPGLTLRDWFAGRVLSSAPWSLNEGDAQWIEQHGAAIAYRIADAMLAARVQP